MPELKTKNRKLDIPLSLRERVGVRVGFFLAPCLLLLATLVSVLPAWAVPGDITTIAGGTVGDGGIATSAFLKANRFTTDSQGSLYIADYGTHSIRKVDTSGVITTVAGNGTPGYSGDGGAATSASLNSPSSVSVDSSGNIYIADSYNNRIRKVDTSGVITTVAGNGAGTYSGDGGSATSAGIRYPNDIAIDSSGNLYIADFENHRIRKINSAGIITTIAGNGTQGYSGDGGLATSAQLKNPDGVAVDASGNIYIGDTYNCRVRKVDTAGVITTIVGDGSCGYYGDGGQASSASVSYPRGISVDSSGNIYIADYSSARIRKINSSTGVITTVAGNGNPDTLGDGGLATSASIYWPRGVHVDSNGNIYIGIAYYYDDRIRKVDGSTGIIATVAGAGGAINFGDGGLATSAKIYSPSGIHIDTSGNIYVSSIYNNTVRKINTAGTISTVAGNGTRGFSGDGGLATSAATKNPIGLSADSAGNIYIADTDNCRIRKVNTSGVINTVAGNGICGYSGDGGLATSARISYPYGVSVDSTGNIYIADGSCRIRRVDTAGIITTAAGNGTCNSSGDDGPASSASINRPFGIHVDTNGNIYIATETGKLRKVDISGVITTVASSVNAAWRGVSTDTDGNIYIAESSPGNIIRKVTPSGLMTTIAGTGTAGYSGDGGPATSANINNPYGVSVDSTGNIYIADTGNHRIRKVQGTGDTTPPTGSISINSGAASTSSTSVSLTLSCTDTGGCSEMQFSNDNSTWSTAEAYSTSKAWTLSSGDGTKTVYVKFKDAVGNWSTATISDTITLDTTPPNTTINSSPSNPTNSTSASFSVSSDEGGSTFQCRINGGSYGSCSTPINFTSLSEGSHTFDVRATDSAGNTDSTAATYTWTVDITPPATGSVIINSGATSTTSASVTLTLSCTDTGSGCSDMQFSNDNTNWSTSDVYATSKSWTLSYSCGNPTRTVYAKFKDTAGNWSTTYTDTINLYATGIDLTICSISAPGSATTGQSVSVSNTVTNQGVSASSKKSYVRFYLSADTAYSAPDTYLGSRSVLSLSGGGNSSASTSLNIPTSVAPGTYYIIAVADATSLNIESDEGNNAAASSAISVAGGIDLTVSSISAPGSATTGQSVSVSNTVTNQGVSASSKKSYVRFYLSADTAYSAPDTYLGSRSVLSLSGGGNSSASTSLNIPTSVAPGTYYIIAVADATSLNIESDEGNNAAASGAISVAGGIDLTVSSISAPGSATTGQSVSVSNTVTNQGSSTSNKSTGKFYLSADTAYSASDTYLGSRSVASLSGGGNSSASTSLTISTSVAPGTYYIIAVADATSLNVESNEGNNTAATSAITVTAP